MNKVRLLWFLITLGLTALAFMAGRLSKPAPKLDIPTHSAADMDAAWQNFLQAQDAIRNYIMSQPQFQDSPQSAAQGYRSLLYNMAGAIELSLHDPDFPRFSRMPDLGSKSGMDNPDNEYKMAIIDGSNDYLITGQMHSDRHIYLQTVYGQPGVGDAGAGRFAGTLSGADIDFDKDGNFKIHVSPNAPDDGSNWLKTDKGVETVLLRYSSPDWHAQPLTDWIEIVKICPDCSDLKEVWSPEKTAALLNDISASLHDRTVSWVSIASRIWSLMPVNAVGKPRLTPNGLTGQYSAFGKFELMDDEALIVSVPVSNADYQGAQLGNRWFHSLEYAHRQSSLTLSQAKADADGMIHFVISKHDPGVWNWLDTDGLNSGLVFLRWQGAKGPPAADMESKIIKLSGTKTELPDAVYVTAQQRQAQIALRAKAISRRYQ